MAASTKRPSVGMSTARVRTTWNAAPKASRSLYEDSRDRSGQVPASGEPGVIRTVPTVPANPANPTIKHVRPRPGVDRSRAGSPSVDLNGIVWPELLMRLQGGYAHPASH